MNDRYDYDLVCIGSGPAGQRGAVQAAKLGKRVAVIERRRGLGGGCLETGTIPSKTFREAVLYFAAKTPWGRRRALTSEDRPSAETLWNRVDGVLRREAEVIEDQLERNDIRVVWGEASFVDPHTLTIRGDGGDERRISTDKVLIAVGTTPTRPPGIEPGDTTVITSDGIVDMTRLPRRMAVVGGGVIGVEYASMFASLGVEVTVIDQRAKLLRFMDGELVDELVHQMRAAGVTFRLGEAVERLEQVDAPTRRAVVHLASGKRIVSDLVLFSIGRRGATETLNLGAAGLDVDDRGRIDVDDRFCTSAPHIFAAGDIIGHPSLAATSSRQGRLAARYAFDLETEKMQDSFPIGIYAVPELSMVGRTEEELTESCVPYETGVARYREIARGQILGDDTGFLKMLFHRDTHELLGVHVVGTGATELLHIGQAVLRLNGGLEYFLETVFNYPTLAECYKVAAFDAANKLSM